MPLVEAGEGPWVVLWLKVAAGLVLGLAVIAAGCWFESFALIAVGQVLSVMGALSLTLVVVAVRGRCK